MNTAFIILAAGNSRRFHGNKLLHEIEGIPMYQRTITELIRARDILNTATGNHHITITVVTQYEQIASFAGEKGCKVVRNSHPEEGISSSLKLGLTENQEADTCLFTVSDQPWLTAKTVVNLVQTFLSSGKGIACLASKKEEEIRLGNPCIFARNYYHELLSLTGDIGGKKVILRHPKDTELLFLQNEKELTDIDYK